MSEDARTDRGANAESAPEPTRRRFTPPVIIACVLAGLLMVAVAVAGIVLRLNGSGAVGLAPVDAPQANSRSCASLLAKMPAALPNSGPALPRRPIAKPAPPAVAAWGDTADPVVLRCGLNRPAELTPTSELLTVSGVSWLRVNGDNAATWYVVDRPVYVALTLPGGLSTGPIQEMSSIIGSILPLTPPRFTG